VEDDVRTDRLAGPTVTAPGFYARPATRDPDAAVVVVHEAFGLNRDIERICERLAEAGFAAFAPDLYDGRPDRLARYDERDKAIAMLKGLDDDEVLRRLRAATAQVQTLGGSGVTPLGLVGFRIGGRYVLLAAAAQPDAVRAAVAYYGPGIDGGRIGPGWTHDALAEAGRIRCRLLLLFAGADPTVPADEVGRIEERLRTVGTRFELVTYPAVRPGFPFEGRDTYAAREAADAWRRVRRLFDEELGRPGAS
jgi:carboxymethylenebutenolidase